MAIRLNQKINLVSSIRVFFALYRNIAIYRLLILNAASSRECVQE